MRRGRPIRLDIGRSNAGLYRVGSIQKALTDREPRRLLSPARNMLSLSRVRRLHERTNIENTRSA